MRQAMRRRLRFGTLGLLAVLVAAPGVHLFERWFERAAAVRVSHGLAVLFLAIVIWRWRATGSRDASSRGRAV